ncbi:MAG: YHYH protein, partial [Verrucomicrobiales bacterium]|nr:YHYH protein [Verrucomicrobiales bacterium]
PGVHFIEENLAGKITIETRALADGTKVPCYIIQTKSIPHEHIMGPWSPETITDGKDKGGKWFHGGKLHDVDGPFVKNIGQLYNDEKWKLYNEDGTVRVTKTREAFMAAARPDVDPAYTNHVVEGQAEWVEGLYLTVAIPVTPVRQDTPVNLSHGAMGLALNGVAFDPPAPIEAILGAYTIAPLDDHGGHLNPFEGYHYHAATGSTKEVAQSDGHAPLIGLALDGYPIFAHLDTDGNPSTDLDECGGHSDEVRGYHYHAGSPGSNQIIKAFRGARGVTTYEGLSEASQPGGKGKGQKGKGKGPKGEGPQDE